MNFGRNEEIRTRLPPRALPLDRTVVSATTDRW